MYQHNEGRKRSPVKAGTLIDVVMNGHYATDSDFGFPCESKSTLAVGGYNYIVVLGVEAGNPIRSWSRTGDIGDIIMWREHGEDSVPPTQEELEEALIHETK